MFSVVVVTSEDSEIHVCSVIVLWLDMKFWVLCIFSSLVGALRIVGMIVLVHLVILSLVFIKMIFQAFCRSSSFLVLCYQILRQYSDMPLIKSHN